MELYRLLQYAFYAGLHARLLQKLMHDLRQCHDGIHGGLGGLLCPKESEDRRREMRIISLDQSLAYDFCLKHAYREVFHLSV